MYFPQLSTPRQSRVTVSRFLGLDRRPRGQEGSFREMENLCADGYPTLTVRRPRGVAGSAVSPGGLTVKEGLIWVDGHTLYIKRQRRGAGAVGGEEAADQHGRMAADLAG